MRRGNWKISILIVSAIVVFAFIRRYRKSQEDPYARKFRSTNMAAKRKLAEGLQSGTEMAKVYGGLHPQKDLQDFLDSVGAKLAQNSIARKTPYNFEFHLLADDETSEAFVSPEGEYFITYAYLSQLNEDQLASILAHEMSHVLVRHFADSKTLQTSANGTSAEKGQQKSILNGPEYEFKCDNLGVLLMIQSGYNPLEMIRVMERIKAATRPYHTSKSQNTHPDPDIRIEKIKESIEKYSVFYPSSQ